MDDYDSCPSFSILIVIEKGQPVFFILLDVSSCKIDVTSFAGLCRVLR